MDGYNKNSESREPRSLGAKILDYLLLIIYRIPIVGGYCAPTYAPKDDFCHHFSNEESVFRFLLWRYEPRIIFEHNCFLRHVGKIGLEAGDRYRRPIFLTAFLFSLTGWAMAIVALSSLSDEPAVIRNTYWTYFHFDDQSLEYYVGLSKIVGPKDSSFEVTMSSLSDTYLCDSSSYFETANYGLVHVAEDSTPDTCTTCSAARTTILRLVYSSAIAQIFQITTDLQRTTRYGDMNCQKCFGLSTSIYGLIAGWVSLVKFRVGCGLAPRFRLPWRQTFPIDVVQNKTGLEGSIDMEVKVGPAYVCLFLTVIFKLFDVLAHLLVPTPENKQEPVTRGVSLAEYMQGSIRPGKLLDDMDDDGDESGVGMRPTLPSLGRSGTSPSQAKEDNAGNAGDSEEKTPAAGGASVV